MQESFTVISSRPGAMGLVQGKTHQENGSGVGGKSGTLRGTIELTIVLAIQNHVALNGKGVEMISLQESSNHRLVMFVEVLIEIGAGETLGEQE